MSRPPFLWPASLSLAACASQVPTGNDSIDINAAAMQAQQAVEAYGAHGKVDHPVEVTEPDAGSDSPTPEANPLASLDPPAPGTLGGLPDDRAPISEAPFSPDSAQGAANVVQTYYALIGEQKYRDAFALRESGASGSATAAAFAADFGRYSEYHANVGAPGAIDAGAGQRYVTVPVQIYARLKHDGTPVYQLGSVVLHRTGAIDGATAEQRTWRIRSIELKVTNKR